MDVVELSHVEATGIPHLMQGGKRTTVVVDHDGDLPNTENIYQEISDAVGEMYERMDDEVTANPLVKTDKEDGDDGKYVITSPTSDIDDVTDVYEHMGTDTDASVTVNQLASADIKEQNRVSSLYL